MRIVRQNATLCEVEIGERLKSTFTCEKWNLTFHFRFFKVFLEMLHFLLAKLTDVLYNIRLPHKVICLRI